MEWYDYKIRDLTDAEYARYYALMTPEKRGRVDRFRFPDDKKRSVAAELLARRAVAARCGVPEESIIFALAPTLKPYAAGLDAEFSVAHSHDLAVCAVDDRPVGIDVELIRPVDLAVARRVCAPAEQAYIFGRPPEPSDFARTEDLVVLERFFRVWTRTEALGKCTGEGVFHAPRPLPETGFRTFRLGQYVISTYQEA